MEEDAGKRKFMRYAFFKAAREWRSLDSESKRKGAEEFLGVLERYSGSVDLRCYSLVGTRGDVDFMIWIVSDDLARVQGFVSDLLASGLGKHLETPYSFLAMTRRSKYIGSHKHPGQEGSEDAPARGAKYAFVYPLVKKREWYSLPFAERQRIMAEHFRVGHKYPSIKINTGYSFGLDDQEFVLAFEGDDPGEFLDLVEELRTSEASRYTERETPIFTCAAVDRRELVRLLG
ncbi:MAG: chlorite dismutase family protein [Nitrososphaerota archaeon]|jgi:chlorite dismutase|nr:chlorite dismutase family protein [Nitrososphaerota archaeon]